MLGKEKVFFSKETFHDSFKKKVSLKFTNEKDLITSAQVMK